MAQHLSIKASVRVRFEFVEQIIPWTDNAPTLQKYPALTLYERIACPSLNAKQQSRNVFLRLGSDPLTKFSYWLPVGYTSAQCQWFPWQQSATVAYLC